MKPRSLIAAFSVTAIVLSIFALSVPAEATNSEILKASEILNAESTVGVVEFNPSHVTGAIRDLYLDSGVKFIAGKFDVTWYATEEDLAYVTKATDAIQKVSKTNSYYDAALDINGITDDVALIEMPETTFSNEVLSNLKKVSLFSEDSYKDTKIYTMEYDSSTYLNHNGPRKGKELRAEAVSDEASTWAIYSFMYHKGYLIHSSYKADLENLLDATSYLSSDDNFKSVATNLDPAAINLYYDMKQVKDEIASEAAYDPIMQESLGLIEAAKAIGISGDQTAKGFKMQIYYLQDSSKIKSLGYDFNNCPKVSLYKYMPNEMPIFFMDSTTSEKNIKKSMKIMRTMIEDVDQELANEELLDMILDSAGTENAFLLQGPTTGSLVPQMTFLAKTSGKTNEAIEENLRLAADAMWTELQKGKIVTGTSDNQLILQKDGSSMTIEKSIVTIDGATAYKFTGDYMPKKSKNPYAVLWPRSAFEFSLTFGLMNNDILLLSTNNNIETEYKSDLSDNKDIAPYLKGNDSSVGYFNTPNLSEYFYKVIKTMDVNSRSDMNYQQIGEVLDTAEKIVEEVAFTGKSTNSSIETDLEINMDFSKIGELINLSSTVGDLPFDTLTNSSKEFSDVNITDWFGDTVYKMSSEGVLNGYDDGTFEPNNSVSRAEFIKMLMTILEKSGKYSWYEVSIYSRDDDYGYFSDVPAYSWFEEPVYAAYNLGLVNGYSKDNFNPGSELRRDQAAKIIANTIRKYAPESIQTSDFTENKFKDLKNSNMSYDDILMLNNIGVMSGEQSGKFNPARALSRAEAAKILSTLSNLLK